MSRLIISEGKEDKAMRSAAFFLFLAMVIAAVFAFTGPWHRYPLYVEPIAVAPYEFATFLFWIFLMLFLVAVLIDVMGHPAAPAQPEKTATEYDDDAEKAVTGGFIAALSFIIITAVSAVFGFELIASTVAGLAMIIFWISITLAVAAMLLGMIQRNRSEK